jgi:hypothetical protein
MPIYHIYAKALARLHTETFHTDPLAVRVMFSTAANPNVNKAYVFPPPPPSSLFAPCSQKSLTCCYAYYILQGGYGFSPAKGVFGDDKVSDYMIAHVNFYGPLEVWQEFCRIATKLYGNSPSLASIYLQRLEAEFELGELVSTPSVKSESSSDAPPEYVEQLKK